MKSLLASFYFAVGSHLRIYAFGRGQEPTLQNIEDRIGVFLFGLLRFQFFFFLFLHAFAFTFFFGGLKSCLGRHKKVLLFFVCAYTFVFFNPQAALSNAKSNAPVYCPDGLAYQVSIGHYIRCEDFDLFHEEQHRGKIRADLYIGGTK